MITEAQQNSIDELKALYDVNVIEYVLENSKHYCSFIKYKNGINEKDTSITVAMTLITNIGDDDIPRTKLTYINILEDGHTINLNDMLNIQEQGNYIKNLIKIE